MNTLFNDFPRTIRSAEMPKTTALGAEEEDKESGCASGRLRCALVSFLFVHLSFLGDVFHISLSLSISDFHCQNENALAFQLS